MATMINESALDEIKRRLDIVEFISGYVQLKRAGRNYKGLCPFHGEKTPSFMVSADKQIFHCFGCGAGGDVAGFLMKHDGVSFPEALEILGRRAGVEVKQYKGSGPERGVREQIRSALMEAVQFYADRLKRAGEAQDYIAKRGLSEESVSKFTLGFAPPGWNSLRDHLKSKKFPEAIMKEAGLCNTGTHGLYDIFRHRLMFPILDLQGEPVAFGGRVMDPAEEPKYLNSPESPLFKKSETLYALNFARDPIRKDGQVMVVEGYMDAIMCHQHGLGNVVAPLGTALTAGHLKKLTRYTDNIVLLFDGDTAGLGAAKRSLTLALEAGIPARVLLLPSGEDPDSLLRSEGGLEKMRAIIARALSPMAFLLRDGANARTVTEALEIIAKIENPIIKDRFLKEISQYEAKLSGTVHEMHALNETIKRISRPNIPARKIQTIRAYNEETLLLSVVLHDPSLAPVIIERLDINEDIQDPCTQALLKKLCSGSQAQGLEAAEGEAERELVTHLSVQPGFEPEQALESLEDCIKRILLKKITRQIKDVESQGEAMDRELHTRLLATRRMLREGTSD